MTLGDCKSGDFVWMEKIGAPDNNIHVRIVDNNPSSKYVTVVEVGKNQKPFLCVKTIRCVTNHKGSNWRLKCLTTSDLLDIFWFFDSHGLIANDLCFDPEHFMETVAKEFLHTFDSSEYIKSRKRHVHRQSIANSD